ncbi:MAG: hypothetical protein GY851_17105, partial [bacterium]|nr:hypothetical protein [bacterium]
MGREAVLGVLHFAEAPVLGVVLFEGELIAGYAQAGFDGFGEIACVAEFFVLAEDGGEAFVG